MPGALCLKWLKLYLRNGIEISNLLSISPFDCKYFNTAIPCFP